AALEEVASQLLLSGDGLAGVAEPVDEAHLCLSVGSRLAPRALRQRVRGLIGKLAVEKRQRLRNDRRDRPARAARVRVGAIERFEKGESQVAPDENIQATAVAVFVARGDWPHRSLAAQFCQFRGKLGKDGRPAHRWVQLS